MKASDIPATKVPTPWAKDAGGAYIRAIPATSQIGIQDGAASWPTGYVPLNMIPEGSGGVPPFGQDTNGVLNVISAWTQWMNAGGPLPWDSAFSTTIGGYPKGAIVASTITFGLFWLCTADDNTTNPDTGGANWQTFPTILPATGAQLQLASSTSLLLAPMAGGYLWINGANYLIPASLTLSNSGLSASTLYYVYAYMNSGTMTLEASTTGYTLASNGIPQKVGDATRTLVGMAYVDGSTHFNDTALLRNVASYFNRRGRAIQGITSTTTITSVSFIEVATACRVEVVTWLDDGLYINLTGSVSGTAGVAQASVGVDGTTVGYGITSSLSAAISLSPAGAAFAANPVDGHHVLSPFGLSEGGDSINFTVGIQSLVHS